MRNLHSMSAWSIAAARSRRGRESITTTFGFNPVLPRSAISIMSSVVGDEFWFLSMTKKAWEKVA